MSFPRYPEYKDSGVEWLGKVPAHWEIKKLKHVSPELTVGIVVEPSKLYAEEGVPALRSLNVKAGAISLDNLVFITQEGHELHLKSKLRAGDIVAVRTGQPGTSAVVPQELDGCNCIDLIVIRRPTVSSERFLCWYLGSDSALVQFSVGSGGAIQQHFNISTAAELIIAVPPLAEQTAIAAFLDHEAGKIDALVAEQQRLIELLREKRQAVISNAVTKGLNPDAPMKPSGVEWLGEVPAHWRVGKCGYYVSVISGFAFPSAKFSDNPSHHKLLRGINVGVGSLRWDDVVYWEKHSNDGLDEYELRAGELVLGMDRPLIAAGVRVAKLEAQDLPCLLLQRVASIRSRREIGVDYLKALLASPMFVAHFAPDTTGVSVPHISPEQIKGFVVPVPPLPEQASIAAYIDEVTTRSEALITEAERAIDLLQERRTALISAAVTGQIDVRAIADRAAA
jgi:type I restriction enzyme S subunit